MRALQHQVRSTAAQSRPSIARRGPSYESQLHAAGESVADSPDGYDVTRLGRVRLDFRAQAIDVGVDRVLKRIVGRSPDMVEQLSSREYSRRVAHEVGEEVEFLRGQVEGQAGPPRGALIEVDLQITDSQDPPGRRWP